MNLFFGYKLQKESIFGKLGQNISFFKSNNYISYQKAFFYKAKFNL